MDEQQVIVTTQLITTVLTYLNASGYYKSAEEIQNAINVASLDLYKRLRGNLAQYAPGRPSSAVFPEATTATADAVAELYYTIAVPGTRYANLLDAQAVYQRTFDLVLSLEVSYSPSPDEYYPVNIVPDNQFLMMKNNPVIPPVQTRPLGRMFSMLIYEINPFADIANCRARVITLPNPVDFTFTDSDGPIPNITINTPIDWTADKIDNLVYGTVANLGFNLSNGVLVQSGNAMNDKIL
jgi:hypothetical protein